MTLLSPIWLLVVIPLALGVWLFRPPSRLLVGLRATALTLVVLALAGLALRLPSRAGTVVVIADRSLSMPARSEAAQKEVIGLVRARMSSDDQLAVVSFGQQVAVEHPPGTGEFAGFLHQVGGNASSLGEAVETALSLIPRDAPGRLLLLSDGKWTGRDPAALVPQALARNIAIDYRIQERPAAGDLAIARIDAPASVSAGESFLINAWVVSPSAQQITFTLKRGEQVISSGTRQVVSGSNRLTFRDRAVTAGNQAYALKVTGTLADPVPENNTARAIVGVGGPRPLLHLSESPSSGLAKLLRAGGLQLRSDRPQRVRWTLEELSRYSGVILENVPGDRLGHVGMETLAAWVRSTGAGLMMTGGRASYGPGGYYKSPLEPILPVSMELRNEHRKLSLAIVVALDRSGSMAVPVGGGKQKMDLANLGTAQVLEMLGPMDEFGCIAVDTAPHVIAPLEPLRDQDKEGVRSKILGIKSMGGGIYVHEALMAASQMLMKARAGTKHIILFSDANDSERPEGYKELLEKTEKAGITVSVIGLGRETDKDGDLLKDIAKRGKGRIFFTDQPEELPRLFAQDTFVVARNTFLDEPAAIKHLPGLDTLTDQKFSRAANLSIGGYNLCYIRPGATLGTMTLDEYHAPVVAAWQAGAGRVLCFTGEADGKYAGQLTRWDRVGDYFTSLARWTAGGTGPLRDNMLLTQEVREGVNVVQLHLDPQRRGDPFSGRPRVSILRGLSGQTPRSEAARLRWAGADTLAIEVPLDGGETTLTTVDVPGHGVVSLPPVCLPYSPEFRPAQAERGLATLERLGRATGGKERLDLATIWHDLPRQVRLLPVARWLLLAAVLCLLVEVFERRTLLLSGLFRRRRRAVVAAPAEVEPVVPATAPVRRPVVVAPAVPPAVKETPVVREVPAAEPVAVVNKVDGDLDMLDALRKARKKARGRTE